MFASRAAPFGGDTSFVALSLSAIAAPSDAGTVAEKVNIYTVFLDPDTKGMAGVLVDDFAEYCCTTALKDEGECGEGVELGGFIVHANGTARPPKVEKVELTSAGKEPIKGSSKAEVAVEGPQYVIVAACDAAGEEGVRLPDVALSLTVEFKNPYGYLPGQLYGCVRAQRPDDVAFMRAGGRHLTFSPALQKVRLPPPPPSNAATCRSTASCSWRTSSSCWATPSAPACSASTCSTCSC